MQIIHQQPPMQPQPFTVNPAIQGDPAARNFGIVFLGALVITTICAGVGIGVGNISHYRYFPPTNYTYNISYVNSSVVDLSAPLLEESARQLLPSDEPVQKIEPSTTTRRVERSTTVRNRAFWLSLDKL